MQSIKNFLQNEEGVTMVEYGLMAALIALACIVAVGVIGTELNKRFEEIGACLKNIKTCGTAVAP